MAYAAPRYPKGERVTLLRLLSVVFVSVVVGYGLATLMAMAKIAEQREELAHLWDVVKAAGLTEEGGQRGR